jgi:hypothetical protein
MKTLRPIEWYRAHSCIPGPVMVPAGAPVDLDTKDNQHYVSAGFFRSRGMLIEAHDATFYGCRVSPDNVTK